MLHELVPMMLINIQSHVKKSMIITEYLFKRKITNKILYFAVFFVVSWTSIPHLSIFHLTKA